MVIKKSKKIKSESSEISSDLSSESSNISSMTSSSDSESTNEEEEIKKNTAKIEQKNNEKKSAKEILQEDSSVASTSCDTTTTSEPEQSASAGDKVEIKESHKKNETAGRCVFMKNFDGKLKKEEIEEEMKKFGEIEELRVPLRRNENLNRGFLICCFKNKESVAEAVKLNGKEFLGCTIYAEDLKEGLKEKEDHAKERAKKREERSSTKTGEKVVLFVGNLPYELNEYDFKKYVESKGNVKGIRIPQDKETGRKRGFAFFEFDDKKEADAFMKKDLKWDERKLFMKYSDNERRNDFDRRDGGRRDFDKRDGGRRDFDKRDGNKKKYNDRKRSSDTTNKENKKIKFEDSEE